MLTRFRYVLKAPMGRVLVLAHQVSLLVWSWFRFWDLCLGGSCIVTCVSVVEMQQDCLQDGIGVGVD